MWYIPVGICLGGILMGLWISLCYRRDLQAARNRVTAGSRMVETRFGRGEYGDAGDGAPVLLVHGAGGGYDQGVFLGGLLLGEGFRLIAPSRFGYLQSQVPEDSSLEAPADALACLLDALGIDRATVVAVSAGGLPGLAFARRYPRKKEARINRITGSDFVYWLAIRAARTLLLNLLGVSKAVQKGLTSTEMARVDRFLEGMP